MYTDKKKYPSPLRIKPSREATIITQGLIIGILQKKQFQKKNATFKVRSVDAILRAVAKKAHKKPDASTGI